MHPAATDGHEHVMAAPQQGRRSAQATQSRRDCQLEHWLSGPGCLGISRSTAGMWTWIISALGGGVYQLVECAAAGMSLDGSSWV